MRAFGKSACGVLLAALIVAPAFSQSGNGSVRGTVSDPTDAVVPGAKVRLTNTATNVVAETTTNGAGKPLPNPPLFAGASAPRALRPAWLPARALSLPSLMA